MTSDNGNGGVTKPVTETVRALSGTPMLLALVLLNVFILGMATYLIKARSEQLYAERADLLKQIEDCYQKLDGRGP